MNIEEKWVEYDWQAEKQRAVFRVDTALYDIAPMPTHGVLFGIVTTGRDGKLGDSMRDTLSRQLAERLEKKVGLVYAGSVSVEGRTKLFLYGSSVSQLDAVESAADRAMFIKCRCSAASDEDWKTYFKLLYPDAAKMQTLWNKRTIAMMKKQGDVIDAARRINLHVFFPTEPLRIMFDEQARLSGFAIGEPEFAAESSLPYGTVIRRISTLDKAEIDILTAKAVYLAEKFDGRLVHWDCAIMRKN